MAATPLTAVSKYKNGVYQLKVRFGNPIVDPNRKTLHFGFSAAKKWVYRASADDPGKIVTEAEMLAALKALTRRQTERRRGEVEILRSAGGMAVRRLVCEAQESGGWRSDG